MLPSGRAFYCMARGWMKNPAFADQPLTEREAWLWLIEAAAYQPETQRIRGDAVTIARGEYAASGRYLARTWHWSEPKVRRFLKKLAAAGMISKRFDAPSDAPLTVIRLCKYDDYQLMPGARDALSDAPVTHLVTHPSDAPPKVCEQPGTRVSEHDGGDSDAPQRRTLRREKANEAFNKGGLEKAAAGNPTALEMVSEFVTARNEIFGPIENDRGGKLDFIEANRLIAAGLDIEDFRAVVSEQLPRLKARGLSRPRSLKILSGDFDARKAAASRRQAERVTDPERDSWLPMITHFKSTGQWLSAWGHAPGQSGCDMPARLQDECLEARRAA